MDVVLIDAGGANLGSVEQALLRLGVTPRVVRNAETFGQPDRVLLPGVGAAAHAMRLLHARGLVSTLRMSDAPLMGICLGMQLLFEHSEEGDVACLGFLQGQVRKMRPSAAIRVPHMGWNDLRFTPGAKLLAGIEPGAQAYFVHGYAVPPGPACIATTTHGDEISAIVQQGHHCGAQFHPERSSTIGAQLLRNFLRWAP